MRRRTGLTLLATLAGLALLAAAARNLDGAAVTRTLSHARLWPWLPLGLASYAIGHRIRGLRLRRLLSHEVALTPNTATNVVLVGYAMNNVLPARLGEVVRSWLLMERSGLSIVQTLTITLVERLLDALVLLALFAAAASALPAGPLAAAVLPVVGGLLAFTLLALAFGTWAPGPVLAFASRAANRLLPRSHDTVMRQVHAGLGGLEALRHARSGAAVLGWSVLVWLFEAGLYLALLPALGLVPDPLHALFAMTGTNLGLLVPSTPGFVGPFHYFCTQAMMTLGVPRETGFGYAVLVHAAFFVPVTVYGVAVLASHGLSVGRALALSREAEPLPAGAARLAPRLAAAPEAPPSRFVLALTEAAVPLDRDGLSAEAAAPLVREVAAFVGGQLNELPVRLRALFHTGLAGFRIATRLRYARGFCELPAATRRSWFERWAYGPLPLARQLFRPVRATALLAYYERPEVRAVLDAESGGDTHATPPLTAGSRS
jgi:uncharacterized protein (TIRG00374 family)